MTHKSFPVPNPSLAKSSFRSCKYPSCEGLRILIAMTVPMNCKCEKAPTLSQATSPQLSLEIAPHGPRAQHHRHEKLKPTAGSPAPLFPRLPWKRNPIFPAQLCAPGSFGLQWLIGLSLLAFLPFLNLWGREPDVPIWPALVVVSSNVQLFRASFTECLIYLGFPSARSKLLEGKGDAPDIRRQAWVRNPGNATKHCFLPSMHPLRAAKP